MKVKLGKVIQLNPREQISKGKVAKKIAMDNLEPYTREVSGYDLDIYKGGTKFRNKDTLLARITPCLENGKTAYVNILDDNEVAFGSTEYFVLRAKKELIDPLYLYYLSISRKFRTVAIKSMTGTSGRQRVQKDSILNYEFDLPQMEEQKRIAKMIGCLDDKKVLNDKINDNLTNQLHTISDNYFSYFNFNDGSIPQNWTYKNLTDIAEITSGYSYKGKELVDSDLGMATIKNFARTGGFQINGYKSIIPSKNVKQSQYASLFDMLIAHTDLTQNADIIGNAEPVLTTSRFKKIIYSMDIVKVIPKQNKISKWLLDLILMSTRVKAHCLGYVNGTTVLHLSKKALKEFEIPLPNDPEELSGITRIARNYLLMMSENMQENEKLIELKDQLLNKYF
ncbi:restriction endonuclease subunit S [Lactobacillus crispatus]|uniref:restriction endonuclease subunit S n=1 Tax=Lactobacillus crispatus TaxID=47770 RepID=UPI0030EB96D3